MAGYDVAQICLNGHVANPACNAYPDPRKKFCAQCGEPLVQACGFCDAEIRGIYVDSNPYYTADFARSYRPPRHCEACGTSYPWTDRKLQAARELIESEQALAADEKLALQADINDVTRDAPRTTPAAVRIKALLVKIPGAVGSALRDIVIDVASEAAKKIILGP
jgi:hypothetical protein